MNFIIKRLLGAIPTLAGVVLAGFILLEYAPGNPVDTIMGLSPNEDLLRPRSELVQRQKKEWEKKLGLNLPVFYVSVQSSVLPDTLFTITDKKEKATLRTLCLKTGQTDMVVFYRQHVHLLKQTWLKDLNSLSSPLRDSLDNTIAEITHWIQLLEGETQVRTIHEYLNDLVVRTSPRYFPYSAAVLAGLEKGVNFRTYPSLQVWIPRMQFHRHSRFHQWLFGDGVYSKGIIRGDFGISYVTKEPIRNHIYTSLFWSVLLSGLGIFWAYVISIPLGVRMAMYPKSIWNSLLNTGLFVLYSTPVFFLGTLLQTLFANHTYWHIFEPTGVGPVQGFTAGSNLWDKMLQSLPYLVLPLICFTYGSIAFLTKLTKSTIRAELDKPYMITARAKGASYQRVIYVHAFRNALIPLITVFGNLLPVVVGGSVIIESIFTIPGMGTEIFKGYFSNNIPVIISMFTLTGLFTIAGFLLSDILNYLVDPRMRK